METLTYDVVSCYLLLAKLHYVNGE